MNLMGKIVVVAKSMFLSLSPEEKHGEIKTNDTSSSYYNYFVLERILDVFLNVACSEKI